MIPWLRATTLGWLLGVPIVIALVDLGVIGLGGPILGLVTGWTYGRLLERSAVSP